MADSQTDLGNIQRTAVLLEIQKKKKKTAPKMFFFSFCAIPERR